MAHDISEFILNTVRSLFPLEDEEQVVPVRAVVVLECQQLSEDGSMEPRVMIARSDSATAWTMVGLLKYAELWARTELLSRIAQSQAVSSSEWLEFEIEDDEDDEV